VPLPGLSSLSEVINRLMRPEQAARNAKAAATEAQRTVHQREAIEREVDAMTDDETPRHSSRQTATADHSPRRRTLAAVAQLAVGRNDDNRLARIGRLSGKRRNGVVTTRCRMYDAQPVVLTFCHTAARLSFQQYDDRRGQSVCINRVADLATQVSSGLAAVAPPSVGP
jgi:hypothetical protein